MRASKQRLAGAVEAVLAPGERPASTGVGWAAQLRPRVPLLFLGRRQYCVALTDRRVLVFARHRGGPRPGDLVLGKRYEFFTLEKVRRHRPLFQLRVRGANDSRLVLEFRPGQRALAAELAARLRRALPAGRPATAPSPAATEVTAPNAPTEDTGEPTEPSWMPEPPAPPEADVDSDTAAAFWGES